MVGYCEKKYNAERCAGIIMYEGMGLGMLSLSTYASRFVKRSSWHMYGISKQCAIHVRREGNKKNIYQAIELDI